MKPGDEIPWSLTEAYRLLSEDRAWVACFPTSEGVSVVGSAVTTAQIAGEPVLSQYLSPHCRKLARASFLLGGINSLKEELVS